MLISFMGCKFPQGLEDLSLEHGSRPVGTVHHPAARDLKQVNMIQMKDLTKFLPYLAS